MRYHWVIVFGWLAMGGAALAAEPAQDRAGNRLQALTEQAAGEDDAHAQDDLSPRYCSDDQQWCLRTRRAADPAGAQLEVEHRVAGEAEPRLRVIPLPVSEMPGHPKPWPFIVRMGPGIGAPQVPRDRQQAALENVLVGVLEESSTGYSGGGANASTLRLSRIHHQDDGIQIDPEVLLLPADGDASIRACFGEADIQTRAGACQDEYSFSVTLQLDPAGQGMPVLRYRTTATRYPAGVSRQRDSLAGPPLHARDLRIQTDRRCSYQRVLRFDGHRYQLDAPLPDCGEFTEL